MVNVSPGAIAKPVELSTTVGGRIELPQLKDGLSAESQGPDLPSINAVIVDVVASADWLAITLKIIAQESAY